ncbi:hypothetical protein [Notoacmeibacter sp. MSK16QG-6]|uniref:hypothetical protein n=1 Tax=Notoacmeibacter sp. MSK16QG-6 TaxID=2957982 RepID=UPI00209EA3BF|nr:hypothetical protein [Notoacmeibacter sp. MSK16QG-6]MCP1198998.1 hypothetical protein [Notoacmeibacter sp. MSK16QG-6]
MNKLEESYAIIGETLSLLAEGGLLSRDLHPDQIKCSLDRDLKSDVFHWMKNEGILSYKASMLDSTLCGAQITSVGIALLQDRTFFDNESIADVIPLEGSGISEDLLIKIGSFVGSTLGGFTKSLG